MNVTPEFKARVDAMDYQTLLEHWRYAPLGCPDFQGERGEYFAQRMQKLREQPGGHGRHVAASKAIGWDR